MKAFSSLYRNEIISAINDGKKIIFLYFDYNEKHERVYRRDGHHYVVSPFATVFADGHYYLVIYDKRYKKMTHYRIDRMERVEIIDQDADVPPAELAFDIAVYKKQLFGMFSGESAEVTLELHHTLLDAVFDLFGDGVRLSRGHSEGTVCLTADVQISPLFFGWCCSFGEKLKLISPASAVEQLAAYTKKLSNQYS
jgi:predicted DNA-binding transcriptional regulator YafY